MLEKYPETTFLLYICDINNAISNLKGNEIITFTTQQRANFQTTL